MDTDTQTRRQIDRHTHTDRVLIRREMKRQGKQAGERVSYKI